jgi:DNA-binding NarL/FixJ family response regulator
MRIGDATINGMPVTVLLVDDHKIVREGTRQLLSQSAEIKVVGEATDGREAVSLAGTLMPQVVVMDVRLPNLSGIEATRIISEQFPQIKVLILSAYDDDGYVFPLFEAGASGYLLKTSSGEELVKAICTVSVGETALSPRVGAKLVKRVSHHQVFQAKHGTESLTARELEVMRSAAHGLSNKAIAAELEISIQTVQVHLRNIFSKLQVSSRSEAIALAIKYGWVTLESPGE